LPGSNGQSDNLATVVAEVSERMAVLVREEIELAKAEMSHKVSSIARGAAAVAAGAVFGVFAVIFLFMSVAWGLNSALNSLWLGFVIVLAALVIATVGAFLFAWRKLKVGAPAPTMALEEAKKIRATVSAKPDGEA
jgi:uncharacterized small protein (DUF1192 family)